MNKKILVEELFNKLSSVIIENVEEVYHEELLSEYKNYLREYFSKYQDDSDKIESYIKTFTKIEMLNWSNMNQDGKLSLLLKDRALEKIREISSKGFQYAKDKFNQMLSDDVIKEECELDKQEIEQNIQLLEELLPKVREFNKGLAANLVSEGVLDYNYLLGNTNITSLRLGRLYK